MAFLAKQLVVLWVVLLGVLTLGSLVRRGIPPLRSLGNHAGAFLSLALGLLGFCFVTAIYFTQGRTLILLAGIPLVGLWRRETRTSAAAASRPPQTALATWLGTFATITLFYVAQAAPLRAPAANPLGMRIPHPDTVFLGFLAESLTATGLESIYPYESVYSTGQPGLTPYHYFEVWLAAGLARISGMPAVVTYSLWVVPMLAVTVLLGMWALAEHFGTATPGSRVLLGLLYFIPMPPAAALDRILPGSSQFVAPLFPFAGKALSLAALLLVATLLFLNGLRPAAFGALLAVIPLSVLGGPGAAFLASSAVAFWLWRKDQGVWRLECRLLCLTLAGIVVFYALLGDRTVAYASPERLARANFDPAVLRTKVNIVGKSCLQALVAYGAHALVLGVLCWRSSARQALATLSLATTTFALGGVFGYALASAQLDGHAFATQPVAVAAFVLLVVAWTAWRCDPAAKRALTLGLCTLGLGSLVHSIHRGWVDSLEHSAYNDRHDTGYLREVASLRLFAPQGGFLVAADEIGDPWDSAKPMPAFPPTFYPLGAYLAFFRAAAAPTMLGTFELNHTNARLVELAPFYRYARGSTSPEDEEVALGEYIDEARLSYVVASAAAQVPAAVRNRADRWIRDPGTGQRFIVLREPVQVHSPP